MASKSKATEAPAKEAETKVVPAESTYSREELANNHKVFDTYREIVDVALRLTGKDEFTFAEAKIIIEKFKNKEVK